MIKAIIMPIFQEKLVLKIWRQRSIVFTHKAFSQPGQATRISNQVIFTKSLSEPDESENIYYFDQGVSYRIISGNSSWKIAKRFYGEGSQYTKIIEANKETYPSLIDNPGGIQPGWVLSIP